jgi:DHA1 family tetracycline resistance protein-like MFS transporter
MFAFMIPYSFGGLAMPAIQGLIANPVPSNEQGEMPGAITSLVSVTAIIGPVIMTNLFYFFTSDSAPIYFPGAPFMLGAVLALISVIIALYTVKKAVNKAF